MHDLSGGNYATLLKYIKKKYNVLMGRMTEYYKDVSSPPSPLQIEQDSN